MHDSGNRKEFPGGGMRDTAEDKERFELLWNQHQPYDEQPMTEYAVWMAKGAEKYEDRNWEQFEGPEAEEHAKGSLARHFFKFLAGLTDEDHGSALKFNVDAIKLVRWKKLQAEKEVEDLLSENASNGWVQEEPKARYFLDNDSWYYRLLGLGVTYVMHENSGREFSFCDGPDDPRLQTVKEIPIDEVPEWAR